MFDSALNYKSWVLEGNFLYQEDEFIRKDVRLVKDMPEEAIRMTAGDISSLSTTNFTNNYSLGGFSLNKNMDITNNKTIKSGSTPTSFILETKSEVKIYINDILQKTIKLYPGEYDIKDFNLANGNNNIVISIQDEFGRTETKTFSIYNNTSFLKPGENKYAAAYGKKYKDENNKREYLDKTALSLNYAYGINNNLMLGIAYQQEEELSLVSTQIKQGSAFGVLTTDLGFSKNTNNETGYALNLNINPNIKIINISGNIEYREENFKKTSINTNNTKIQASLSLSKNLFNAIGLNFNYNYNQYWDNTYYNNYRISLNKNIFKAVNTSFSAYLKEYSDINKEIETGFSVNLTYRPNNKNTIGLTHSTNYNNITNTTMNWQHAFNEQLKSSLNYTENDTTNTISSSFSYQHNRFNSNLNLNYNQNNSNIYDNDTGNLNLNVGTSLMFADNKFTISKPVNDSFAIITKNNDLDKYDISLSSNNASNKSYITNLMPGTVNLTSYKKSSINIDTAKTPLGYNIDDNFIVYPTYKSGHLIDIGGTKEVILNSKILNTKKEAIALEAGEIISINNKNIKPVEFFTNRTGKIRVSGLLPNEKYEVSLYSAPNKKGSFEIEKNSFGMYDIKEIIIDYSQSKEKVIKMKNFKEKENINETSERITEPKKTNVKNTNNKQLRSTNDLTTDKLNKREIKDVNYKVNTYEEIKTFNLNKKEIKQIRKR